jgi:reactive intermediate/imine deaminase
MGEPIHYVLSEGPRPVAPYSHAVEAGGFVFVTGQLPTDPAEPEAPLPAGIEAQVKRVFENLALVLGSVGLGLEHTVMARIYLTDFARDYAALNALWERYFKAGRLPARTTVGVAALGRDALVEIDLVARRP